MGFPVRCYQEHAEYGPDIANLFERFFFVLPSDYIMKSSIKSILGSIDVGEGPDSLYFCIYVEYSIEQIFEQWLFPGFVEVG